MANKKGLRVQDDRCWNVQASLRAESSPPFEDDDLSSDWCTVQVRYQNVYMCTHLQQNTWLCPLMSKRRVLVISHEVGAFPQSPQFHLQSVYHVLTDYILQLVNFFICEWSIHRSVCDAKADTAPSRLRMDEIVQQFDLREKTRKRCTQQDKHYRINMCGKNWKISPRVSELAPIHARDNERYIESYLLHQIAGNIPHNFEHVVVVEVSTLWNPKTDVLETWWIFAIRLERTYFSFLRCRRANLIGGKNNV